VLLERLEVGGPKPAAAGAATGSGRATRLAGAASLVLRRSDKLTSSTNQPHARLRTAGDRAAPAAGERETRVCESFGQRFAPRRVRGRMPAPRSDSPAIPACAASTPETPPPARRERSQSRSPKPGRPAKAPPARPGCSAGSGGRLPPAVQEPPRPPPPPPPPPPHPPPRSPPGPRPRARPRPPGGPPPLPY